MRNMFILVFICFPLMLVMLSAFLIYLLPTCVFFREKSMQVLYLFKNWPFFFLSFLTVELLFLYTTPCQIYTFLPFRGLSFYFVDIFFFYCAEAYLPLCVYIAKCLHVK